MKAAFEKYWETLDVDSYPETMTKTDFRILFYAGYRAALNLNQKGA